MLSFLLMTLSFFSIVKNPEISVSDLNHDPDVIHQWPNLSEQCNTNSTKIQPESFRKPTTLVSIWSRNYKFRRELKNHFVYNKIHKRKSTTFNIKFLPPYPPHYDEQKTPEVKSFFRSRYIGKLVFSSNML